MDERVVRRIEGRFGSRARRITAVHGGDNSAAYRVELEDGRVVFAKTHAGPPEGWFTTEATGLEWLRAASAVRVPAVLAVGDGDEEVPAHLVMEWIEPGGRRTTDEVGFGRKLANLHRAGAPAYGREDRRPTGSRRLPDDRCATWPEFYAARRLLPLADLASEANTLDTADIDRLRRLADRLDQFGGADEPPARLHGDLWGGNRLVDHRGERLARRPGRARRPSRVRSRHDAPVRRVLGLVLRRLPRGLPTGARIGAERVELHQISTLVVHAIKFGGGYVRRGECDQPLRLSDLSVVTDEPLSEREELAPHVVGVEHLEPAFE